MTVYNVGLPRTATRSIVNLFEQFGFETKHAMLSQNYNFEISYILNKIDRFKKSNTFYSDTPIWHPAFWDILKLKDQPVIHTFRDKESWINSVVSFNYFKQQQYFNQDEFWFKGYFDRMDKQYLSDVYDKHLKYLNYFNNVLSIDVINQDPDLIIEKICSYLNIERKPQYELTVIGKKRRNK